MPKNTKTCSEEGCYGTVNLDPIIGDVVLKPDGSYYAPSLKCWDCRTDNDKKNIKRKRKEGRRDLSVKEGE